MSASKLPTGPLASTRAFYTRVSRNDGFDRVETCCWNQRHGSIIHTYYKNTASKDTYQITISEGCAFSTSSTISQTHTPGWGGLAESKHAQGVKSLYFNGLAFGITNVISQGSYFLINHPDEYSY